MVNIRRGHIGSLLRPIRSADCHHSGPSTTTNPGLMLGYLTYLVCDIAYTTILVLLRSRPFRRGSPSFPGLARGAGSVGWTCRAPCRNETSRSVSLSLCHFAATRDRRRVPPSDPSLGSIDVYSLFPWPFAFFSVVLVSNSAVYPRKTSAIGGALCRICLLCRRLRQHCRNVL